jgi:DNA-binding SARP family transcriptional activator
VISLRALGPVELSVDGRAAPPELLWRKNLALLVYLARSPRHARTRDHLIGMFWGDKPESSARHSLREAIRVLRQAGDETAIEADADQVRLADGALTTDVETFERHALAGEWSAAAALAVGDFLEGFGLADAPAFEDWLSAERLGIRRRMVDALVQSAEAHQRTGDARTASDLARRALALDPLSDPAARAVMRALALLGERTAALAAYDAFAARLAQQVGAEPDSATQHLAGQIRRERVWREADAAPRGAESRRSPLVGRDDELARVLDLWTVCRGGRATVVLIEGDAGAGRTRLAEEIAARTRLDGAVSAEVRGAPADRAEPWSGVMGLAGGGLLSAGGIGAAPAEALATFAGRLEAWGDRFAAARKAEPRTPGAALSAVVGAAAAEQPVVLLLDDAHWLDGASLEAVHALARDLAALPVLIVLTAQRQPAREEIDQLRARLGRDTAGAALTLGPLGPDGLHALARWAMPAFDAVEVDRLARRIAADSAGLPLLAVELLHAVALGLDLSAAPRAWPEPARTLDQTLPGDLPDSVVAAIRIGFRRLSKDAQAALAAVAVLGEHVLPARLGAATALTAEALAAALDEAEWQRWLTADGRGYEFVARIARDVVARDMVTEGQRRRILDRA